MPSAKARHFVLGMSHSVAIARANDAPDISVITLAGRRAATCPAVIDGRIDGAAPGQVRSLFLALYGNAHSGIGLPEKNPPIWTTTRHGKPVPETHKDRFLVPRSELEKAVGQRLRLLRADFETYRKANRGVPIFAIATPPPVGDAEHILKHPGNFKDLLENGVAPVSLRVEIYRMQIDHMREYALKTDIEFIPPPVEAMNPDGTLPDYFWNRDPSHGNVEYGKLVLAQIKDRIAALPA